MKVGVFKYQNVLIRRLFPALFLMLFSAVLMAQSLTDIEPDSVMQGDTLDLIISGQETHFTQASEVQAWIQLGYVHFYYFDNVVPTSDTTISASFIARYYQYPATYDVKVANPIDGELTLNYAFELVENPVRPELVSVQPDSAVQGESLDLVVSGQNTHFQASSTTVLLKQGTYTISASSNEVLSDTEVKAHFNFTGYHMPGLYDVRTYNTLDGAIYLDSAFTLIAAAPSLTLIVPATAMQGDLYSFDIYGHNTHFQDANTILGFLQNEENQTVSLDFDALTNEHLEGAVIIPYGASAGNYNLHIYNNIDGEVILENAMMVNETTVQPEIMYMDPDSANIGDVLQVSAFTDNTWFTWANSVYVYMKKSGSFQNIYSQGVQFIGDEHLKITFDIAQGSAPGYYDLYVQDNIDGQMIGYEKFYVVDTITGIPETTTEPGLTLYPNPARDILSVSSEELLPDCKIMIDNAAGQRREFDHVTLYPGQPVRLGIGNLSSGLYYIQVSTNEKIIHKKLIKY